MPVARTWKIVLGGIGWGLAAFGALALASLPGDFGHSLCGPWGCFPPIQALAAMHLFWVVVLLPLMGWGLAKGQSHQLRRAGGLLFFGAVLAIVAVTGRDLLSWLPTVPPEFQVYWPRRVLYTLVTQSDVPLVQLLLAGAICWWVGNRSRGVGRYSTRVVREMDPCSENVRAK
jgi:hypothetical protein